jgi:tRNA/tmRNA/rRNA uracil-C5-methylase (TrmA/RlmC/RlmD family)
MRYSAQLHTKKQSVTQALTAYKSLSNVPVADVLGAEHPLGYRTHAKLVLS